MNSVTIGSHKPVLPLIQGGMGVGVSLSSLAGAVAAQDGIGIISTAQIGFQEADFETNTEEANLRAIKKHIERAKSIAGGKGLVGVNVMHALQHYQEHVKAAAEASADVIICGAGLPTDLPALTEGTCASIAPIVSSRRAAALLIQTWQKKYNRLPDFLVIEGPKAGGHLGFKPEQLEDIPALSYDDEITSIIDYIQDVSEKNDIYIPVFVAGGISARKDVEAAQRLGADGVQVATRFVPTVECDASDAYKQAYIRAREEDVVIIQSPVGMPGRALHNRFVERTLSERIPVTRCLHCIKKCNPASIPYCITKALIDAVQGDTENGLVFCGANVGMVKEITTVQAVMEELLGVSSS